MPDLITIFNLEHDEQKTLNELVTQWRAKRPQNNIRSAFYDMNNSERRLMNPNIPEVIRRRKFVLGWSAAAVDKLNRRVNIEDFYDASGNDLGSLGLKEIVRENRLINELSQAGVSSLIHSVSWLVTTQGDVAEGEPEVLVNVRDAATGTGMWSGRKRALTSFLSINEVDDGGEPTSMTMYVPNLNIFMDKVLGKWVVKRRPHIYGVPVDPMRYKPRTGRPFGSSRISHDVMSLHMQALAAMIRADVNGEAYSLSRYVLLGATEEAFKNADGSPKSTWEAAWDAVWAIGDDESAAQPRADVKRFSGESPEPQLAHLRMLAQMFSGATGIPIGELGIIGDSNPTSAEALLASRDDLIEEAGRTADDWTPDISSMTHRALDMLNRGSLPKNLDVRPNFRKPIHVSSAQAADAGAKIINTPGLEWLAETEVGLELVGLTPDQARRAVADRTRAKGREVLNRLAGGNGDVA